MSKNVKPGLGTLSGGGGQGFGSDSAQSSQRTFAGIRLVFEVFA
jgi:hypothetical protein